MTISTLITGGAGFIGHALAKELLGLGQKVIIIDTLNAYYDPQIKRDRIADLIAIGGDNIAFHHADFADHTAIDNVLQFSSFDRIAHLGAQPGVRYSIDNPRAYVQSNLVGHLNMLEIARTRKIPMVYASSSSVYGNRKDVPFRVEDRVDHPISLYAATKKSDELMSETYAHLYRIPLTGLRFFTVYGPWGRPDMAVWSFTKSILEGQPIKVFNSGDMRRDFTYIDDIVAGIIACLNQPSVDDNAAKAGGSVAPHRIYNIGNSQSEELTRLIDVIEAACEKPAIRHMESMQAGDVQDTFADITAISDDLGFAPVTTIDVGVPNFVHWYRAYTAKRA
jgi:UDP-glucuronate 4-epimerase